MTTTVAERDESQQINLRLLVATGTDQLNFHWSKLLSRLLQRALALPQRLFPETS